MLLTIFQLICDRFAAHITNEQTEIGLYTSTVCLLKTFEKERYLRLIWNFLDSISKYIGTGRLKLPELLDLASENWRNRAFGVFAEALYNYLSYRYVISWLFI